MSVCLVLLRFETAKGSPTLNNLSYQAPSKPPIASTGKSFESEAIHWPKVVSEEVFALHRGQRNFTNLLVLSLDCENIAKEMAALDDMKVESGNKKAYVEDEKSSGGIPKVKESTPGPSSSKEGTPSLSDEFNRRLGGYESLHFISGNPTVDVTKGILHLYKENTKTRLDEGESTSEMLCMLAVPTSMSTHDLLQFTAPCYPAIQHLRIIKNSNPNQYMVLIKFRSQEDADLFFNTFNGQNFNSIEPDICRLVYVARVEATSQFEDGGLPIAGHSELPTCPVCLERMDESVDGILTILCNHSFHGECLAKWGDTSCPVCRYCQTPDEVPDQHCLFCGATDSLWICLICGHVGCGRYVGGHAHRHFLETNHLFSLQVGNSRVWDYVRDNYVHRLLQSEGDGKVVSFERDGVQSHVKEYFLDGEEKLNSLQLEYTHLLSSQLETQREFFESKISEIRNEFIKESDDDKERKEKEKKRADEIKKVKEEISNLKREKQMLDKKLQATTLKVSKISNELETEKHLNKNLIESKKELLAKVELLQKNENRKNEEIKELENQLRDVMMHFEAMDKIGNDPECQDGAISLAEKKSTGTRKKKK